ncbi:amidohydrolase family protein [Xanthobacter sp. DSM 24535]|uniref:amidohydrolase family protein n=1 Tax=Roseixanthobacter psychrophilus TaxID=3119917 RepID=UPI00372BC8BA
MSTDEAEGAGAAQAPLCLPPRAPDRTPAFALPEGTCDCHMHVFGPRADYPLSAVRNYTPQLCTLDDYLKVMAHAGIARAVLIQPSVYGTDNRAQLDALARAPDRFRAVVVVEPHTDDAALAALHAKGVRGIRVNARNPGGLKLEDVPQLAARIAPLGWHIQLQTSLERLAELDDLFRMVPVPLVVDHFGLPDPRLGTASKPFVHLLRLLESGRLWLKLSAPYRASRIGAPYDDLLPLVEALVAARPDRLLWASDWPHSELWDAMPDTADLVDLVARWLPTDDLRRQVLVDTPARLYFA